MNSELGMIVLGGIIVVLIWWNRRLAMQRCQAHDALERTRAEKTNSPAVQPPASATAPVPTTNPALLESEARRQALLESALDCIISIDQTGQIIEFNGAAERTFGYASADAKCRALADLIVPTVFGKVSAQSLVDYFTADNGNMLGKRVEMSGVRPSGGEFPVELTLVRVRMEGPPIYTGCFREITDRIKGETALFERASQAALNVEMNRALSGSDGLRRNLQRCAEALIWHIDVAQTRIWTADETGEWLVLQAAAGTDSFVDGPVGRLPMRGSYYGRVALEGRPYIANVLSADEFDATEHPWLAKEKITAHAIQPLLVEERVVGVLALYDDKPLPEGLLTNLAAIADVITQFVERTKAEAHVHQQAALLDEATDAILVRDLAGNIRFWSKGAEKIFGWSAGEATGQNTDKLLIECGPKLVPTAQATVLSEGKWAGEFTLRHRNGTEIMVESRWTLVRDETGKPKSILTIATDITEKKQLEKKFLRTQRLEIIGTLAGGVAHDLNNVLGPIIIVSDLLRKKLSDEKSIGWLAMMQNNALRGTAMVKQILAFARGIAGGHGALQVHHLVTDVERMAQETFPSLIEIETNAPKTLWPIQGDATQIHQILLNLCVNARDAMPNGGKLKIEARNLTMDENETQPHPEFKPGRYVVITVSDNGSGIPPELRDKIFEAFFTTKDPGKGTGLGLSTVKSIVKEHGGLIDVDSTVGVGTTFTLYFPASEGSEARSTEVFTPEQLTGVGELILLVDDELAIRELTKSTLEDFGYQVMTGADGAEAVALFAQHRGKINAVMMDLIMPVMDGLAAIHVLRKIDPRVKLVVVSGGATQEQIAELETLPNTTFLHKPYNADQLLSMLRKTLDKK